MTRPLVRLAQFAEVGDADDAPLRHHRELFGGGNRLLHVHAGEAETRFVEFAQARAAQGFVRDAPRRRVAQIILRAEQEVERREAFGLQLAPQFFTRQHAHFFFSSLTPKPWTRVETSDSAKLRAMRCTAGSSSLKKVRGSPVNSYSPR